MRGLLAAGLWFLAAGVVICSNAARAQQSVDAVLKSVSFPVSQGISLTLTPPPSLESALSGAGFPVTHDIQLSIVSPNLEKALTGAEFPGLQSVNVTLVPPPGLANFLGGAQFPQAGNIALSLTPPPGLGQFLGGAQFPQAGDIALSLTPPPALEQALGGASFPQGETVRLSLSLATASPEPSQVETFPLAEIARANLPEPQQLTLVLVPPPSPYAAIASASFPTPQTLAATLVPPPSPLAPVATANFPAPQGLTAVLVPGGEQASAPAGPAASPTVPVDVIAGGTGYSVQIVQVIPRRGANFFDRNDPTGQSSALAAQTATGGGSTAATCAAGAGSGAPFQPRPPIGREVCHTLRVFSDPAGLGDVLGLHTAVELELFFTPGANLSANLQIRNPGITPMGTYTGTNNSTFSVAGNLTVPVGTAPAGTPIRASGTKPDAASRPQNFSLHVCLPGGVVEYRQADTQCQ